MAGKRSSKPRPRRPGERKFYRRRSMTSMTLVRVEVVAPLPHLHHYIECRRKQLGKTRAQVAKAMGLSGIRYARFWRESLTIKESMLSDLERALDVDRSYWFAPPIEPLPKPIKKLTGVPEAMSPKTRIQRAKENMEKVVQELAG